MEFEDDVNELLEEGLIQRFEYTHEFAWKVMKIMLNIKAILTFTACVTSYVKHWQ
jgi:hypothetical protein